MTRGNQRELAREKNQRKEKEKKGRTALDGKTLLQRKEE
jgi:hypothetical protein